MAIPYKDFIHPADKKALDALKALPGFDLVLKKLLSVVTEKMFKIQNTSSFLRLGPDQLPEIYNILVKVCKRLEVDVPDLYLALDRTPNAYTAGDTDVFIVLHSGLLETLSLDQIETVIAHEVGHIVCHHVLYRTMANLIIQGAEFFVSGLIGNTVLATIKYAFFYWMRCSEYSADRVAAYYYGDSDPVVELMMTFSGATKNLDFEFSKDAYLKQAVNYKSLIDNSRYNKTLEFLQMGLLSHPYNASRAYEINEFYKDNETLLLESKEVTQEVVALVEKEFNLRIRYEYIRQKGLLKFGSMFDIHPLEVKVGKKKYSINKNDAIDMRLNSGEHDITFDNDHKKQKYHIELNKDTSIIVTYDFNTEQLTIVEEY